MVVGLAGACAPVFGQRAERVGDAVALAAAIVQISLELLCRRARMRDLNRVGDVVVVRGAVLDGAVGGTAGNAVPVRFHHGRAAILGGGVLVGIDQQAARCPEVEETGQHTHAGIGFQGRCAGIATLVRHTRVDVREHTARRRSAVGPAQTGRFGRQRHGRIGCGGDDGDVVGVSIATAGRQAQGDQSSHERVAKNKGRNGRTHAETVSNDRPGIERLHKTGNGRQIV